MTKYCCYFAVKILSLPLQPLFRKFERCVPVDYGTREANLIIGFVTWLLKKYHGLGEQKIHLPSTGGVIIVANHVSSIDAFAILGSSERVVRALATSNYNHIPGVKKILEIGNCIFVHEIFDVNGKLIPSNNAARDAAVEALKNNSVVLIFPFGGYHSPLKPEPPIKLGAAKIAKLANEQLLKEGKDPHVKICPMFVTGLNPNSYHKPFKCFVQKNQVGIIEYPHITPQEILDLSAEEISNRIRPLVSMHDERDATGQLICNCSRSLS